MLTNGLFKPLGCDFVPHANSLRIIVQRLKLDFQRPTRPNRRQSELLCRPVLFLGILACVSEARLDLHNCSHFTQRLDKVDGIVEGPFNLNHLISRFLIKLLT